MGLTQRSSPTQNNNNKAGTTMEDQTVPVSPVIFEAVPFGEEEEAEAEPLVASGKGGADNKTTTTDDLVAKGNTLLCVLDKAASHRRGRKYYCCSCLWNTAQIMVLAWSAFLFVLFFGLHEWDVLKAHNQARQFALDLARKNSTELWDFSQSTFNKLQLEMESKNATEWMEYATQKWQQQVQYVAQQMDEHVEYASSWAAQYLTEAEAALEADVESKNNNLRGSEKATSNDNNNDETDKAAPAPESPSTP